MDDVVIIGAGGHGRVVLDILRAANVSPRGFLDADSSLCGCFIDDLEVIGDIVRLETLKSQGVTGAIVAIGDNAVRRKYARKVTALGLNLINAIHPSANIASTSHIGQNVVIAAGALICAHCKIGDSVILNTGCIIDHESIISNSAHICPGAKLAGRVIVDSGAFIGIGATVIQNVRIGTDSIVGAGAVVIKDVPPAVTVVGVPAKILKTAKTEPMRFPPNFSEAALQEISV